MQKTILLYILALLVQTAFAVYDDPNIIESQTVLDNRLIETVKASNLNGIDEALAKGANPNIIIEAGRSNYSPVGYLFFFHPGLLSQRGEEGQQWSNFFSCIKSLLEAGSSPTDCSLMNMAAYHNWPSVIKLLAKHGFNPNQKCGDLLSPIEVAEQEGHFLAKLALLSSGVSDLSESHRKHLLFIHYAQDCNVPAMEDCFIPEEGFVNKPDRAGKYALLEVTRNWVIDSNWYSAISYLLLKDANPNVQNDEGSSALHLVINSARYYESSDNPQAHSLFAKLAVEALIKSHVNLSLQDKEGKTALHRAVENDNIDVVILLLEAGAKNDIADNQGKAPVDYANSSKMKQFFKIMDVKK